MNISSPFIKRPVMTSLIIISILFFGLFAYIFLPVSDLPSVEYPTIQVSVSYPGASPETMGTTIAAPLEREFSTIEKVQSIYSTSQNGQTSIVLQFDLDKPISVAAQDVQARINESLSYLPSDLPNQPTYRKVNPTQSPIMYFAFASDTMESPEIYRYVDAYVSRRISMLSGVSQVNIYGPNYAVRIQVDPEKLAARGINISQVAETLASGNVELPIGTLYGSQKEFTLFADGEIYNAEGYSRLIVRNDKGELVRISDIGQALDSADNDKTRINYIHENNAMNCIAIGVQKMAGANTLEVIQEIKALMPRIREELPASIQIKELLDQSEWIWGSIHDVQITLIIAFLLVAAVTFFFLGKATDSIIPIIALPISIIGTFAAMYLLGYTFDILSLLAMTLSIGFLVDDAIVVLENTVRHLEQGKSKLEAAFDGAKQISFTVLSMTLCLAAVFIPMLFMGGIVGRLFQEFASVIMITVTISGFVALSLTPLLCSRFLAKHHAQHKNWLEHFSEKVNTLFLSTYKIGLTWVLKHKVITAIGGFVSVALTLVLTLIIPKDFIPPSDLGVIEGFTKLEDGTSPFEAMRIQEEISKIVDKNDFVNSTVSAGAYPTSNQGIFWLNLTPYGKRKSIFEIQKIIDEQLSHIPNAQIFTKPLPLIELNIGTSTSMGNYQYTLQSFDTEALYTTAPLLVEKIKQIPGIKQVTSDMYNNEPQINLTINRDKASYYNVTAKDIENTLMYAYGGTKITQINGAFNEYNVILETLPHDYRDPSVLDLLYVGDNQVPLSAIVDMSETVAPLMINHFNTMPAVTITFDVSDVPLSTAISNIEAAAKELLPNNVFGNIQGTADVFKKTFNTLILLIIITLFVIYTVLGILYENFIHPLTVMSSLPPAALGGLLTLLIFHETISLYSFVGIIMLLGIVLKNGIILVDFAVEGMVTKNMDIEEAIEHACLTRFRPIIMTTVAALMGAVPVAIGVGSMIARTIRPLGLVIVGGLIFSQFLTLFLTPVVFIYLERLRRFFRSKKQGVSEKS
ncbi:MAG: efflux RND transporter permease subunit [Simkaniaceae bacterium]|nr:efflux RND transporter permease subunit [Simkaniaceae bacterium]